MQRVCVCVCVRAGDPMETRAQTAPALLPQTRRSLRCQPRDFEQIQTRSGLIFLSDTIQIAENPLPQPACSITRAALQVLPKKTKFMRWGRGLALGSCVREAGSAQD